MPKKKLAKKGFDWKDTEKFDKTASEVGGAIENLTNQLNVLNSEIRADKDGLFDFDQRLSFLYKERIFLENRLKFNNEFAVKFDAQIEPFEKMYDKLTDGMTSLYDNAKTEHKKGIAVLIREFNYHPLWKQSSDCFNATPFKPE